MIRGHANLSVCVSQKELRSICTYDDIRNKENKEHGDQSVLASDQEIENIARRSKSFRGLGDDF